MIKDYAIFSKTQLLKTGRINYPEKNIPSLKTIVMLTPP